MIQVISFPRHARLSWFDFAKRHQAQAIMLTLVSGQHARYHLAMEMQGRKDSGVARVRSDQIGSANWVKEGGSCCTIAANEKGRKIGCPWTVAARTRQPKPKAQAQANGGNLKFCLGKGGLSVGK
jgi:hypothetical protein